MGKCQVKTDCFAYYGGECMALRNLYCKREAECRFYKTREQHNEDRQKAQVRLNVLAGLKK